MEDSAIIDLYWRRDQQAIAETAGKYGTFLHNLAWNILRSHGDSEECVNDTYLRAWNAIPPARPAAFRSWLGRIARNLSLDLWKQSRTQRRGGGGAEVLLGELEDGAYLEAALGESPVLDSPVAVYRFSDFGAPHEQYPAATQAIAFTVDRSATEIFSFGFNGMSWDEESGWRQYSYFVPDGMRREPETKVLVVLGEDIGDYTLQGYRDGGCDAGEEIAGVSCTVTREETTLDVILEELCLAYRSDYTRGRAADQENAFDAVPFEMYRGAVSQLLSQYGLLSGAPKDRYADGRLDDILSETLFHQRVLYLAFPAAVPAGGSVTIDCRMWKEPSFDFYCSGSENTWIQGYDLVTRLGSALDFTRQAVLVKNGEGVEIVRQNLGLDLENGAAPAELDPEWEHYCLEIRPAESA